MVEFWAIVAASLARILYCTRNHNCTTVYYQYSLYASSLYKSSICSAVYPRHLQKEQPRTDPVHIPYPDHYCNTHMISITIRLFEQLCVSSPVGDKFRAAHCRCIIQISYIIRLNSSCFCHNWWERQYTSVKIVFLFCFILVNEWISAPCSLKKSTITTFL